MNFSPSSHPALLVSVRSASEAEAALTGGAALIDVKEPNRGSLGRADEETIAAICRTVAGRRPVSAALGELLIHPAPIGVPGLAFAKWGLAGALRDQGWRRRLVTSMNELRDAHPLCQPVAVAYADWRRANSPPPPAVFEFAREHGCSVLLLDTFKKDRTTLLDWLPVEQLEQLCSSCHSGKIRIALAGSLAVREITMLRGLLPDWFAVRGAVCKSRQREQTIDAARVAELANLLTADVTPATAAS